ncbi:MAG: glycyl-radical enzyme activating protein [bacterium]
MKGIIFNIQEYAVQDGSGIRTTVFLKGCPLRCRWCSNPEGQEAFPELMHQRSRCRKCGQCLGSCPNGAVSLDGDGFPLFQRELCRTCAGKECERKCPARALRIIGEEWTAEALLKKVRTNALFFRNSGGGVTLSGGEPLAQPGFVGEFLFRSKDVGLSVGLETSGFFEWEKVGGFMPLFDFIYFDLKCPDPEIHRQTTGRDLEPILTNLHLLAEELPGRIIVSIPLVPGVNTSDEMMAGMAEICARCGIRKVRLLPCHAYGAGKYEELGHKYPMPGALPPDPSLLEKCEGFLAERGLFCGEEKNRGREIIGNAAFKNISLESFLSKRETRNEDR